MAHVVYHNATTLLIKAGNGSNYFATASAAKAARTRHCNKTGEMVADYSIAEADDFRENIELKVEKVNMMSGKKYMERVNTPSFMSPASEAYWSM